MNPFRHFCKIPCTGIGQLQSLYLRKSAQRRETRTYSDASNGIRTHDPNSNLVWLSKVKVKKLSLCLTKYHVMKIHILLN